MPLVCLFWKNSSEEKCDCGTFFKEERNHKNTRIFKGHNAHLQRYPWQIIIRVLAKSASDGLGLGLRPKPARPRGFLGGPSPPEARSSKPESPAGFFGPKIDQF